MFAKILIANRGEIAVRVATTARRLGVRTVAVYSNADAHAAHVQACDEAVHIGGAAPQDSYLRADRIIEAARATGAAAIHPGYGFLSENAAFAQACVDAGVVFIGPPASAIAAMGSKSAAKRLMEAAGVPLVPGYHGDAQDAALLAAEAGRIGYPVLIKATAGGGGKGMRRVDAAADFEAALSACRREAQNSFADDRVLVERYVTRPRHIEVQVFADTHGGCVHLFERDCSVQRRHQKLLEEAPAPGLTDARRAEMGAAAVAAARAVGYVGAGTVEFIAEPTEGGELRFYFMEMNTRLQVEHPVTEAITGVDLVEWQLRIAAGAPLPRTQDDLAIRGHAVEARICAENPDTGFLPATGKLDVLRWPAHVAHMRNADAESFHEPAPVRVDAGVREGDAITPHYDPMIAKLIAWGVDRPQALARLDAALSATKLLGPANNVAFLRRVVQSPSFATADLDTALIERERANLFDAPAMATEWVAAGVAAHLLATEAMTVDADPWSQRDGWRVGGRARRRIEFATVDPHGASTQHELQWERRPGTAPHRLWLGSQHWDCAMQAFGAGRYDVQLNDRRMLLAVHAAGLRLGVYGQDGQADVRLPDPLAARDAASSTAGGRLTAPMPGRLIALLVRAGDAVQRGQPLVVMEAMKMEHTLAAPRDGVVAELPYAVGDQVSDGAELLKLAEPGDADANPAR